MQIEGCLGHLLRELYRQECVGCTPDTDTSHHPNNYDCPMYCYTKWYVVDIGLQERNRAVLMLGELPGVHYHKNAINRPKQQDSM